MIKVIKDQAFDVLLKNSKRSEHDFCSKIERYWEIHEKKILRKYPKVQIFTLEHLSKVSKLPIYWYASKIFGDHIPIEVHWLLMDLKFQNDD